MILKGNNAFSKATVASLTSALKVLAEPLVEGEFGVGI